MQIDPRRHELVNHEAARHLSRESGLPLTFVRYKTHGGWTLAIRRGDQLKEIWVFEIFEEDGRPLINTAIIQEIKNLLRAPDVAKMRETLWRVQSDANKDCEDADALTIEAHRKLKKLYPRSMHDMPIFNLEMR